MTAEAERWLCWRPRAGEDLNTGLTPDWSPLVTLLPLPSEPLTSVHALLHSSRSLVCVPSHAQPLIMRKLRNKICPLLSLWVTMFYREQIWLRTPQCIFSIHTGKDGVVYYHYFFIKTFSSEKSEVSTKHEERKKPEERTHLVGGELTLDKHAELGSCLFEKGADRSPPGGWDQQEATCRGRAPDSGWGRSHSAWPRLISTWPVAHGLQRKQCHLCRWGMKFGTRSHTG